MSEIIYYSFFRDPGFQSLKHSILYFDKIIIPSNYYLVTFGQNNQEFRFARSVPEDAYDHIEFLKKEKVVDIKEFKGVFDRNIKDYINAVESGINNLGHNRLYSPNEIHEVCAYLEIDPHDPDSLKEVNSMTILASAVCLMEFSVSKNTCCVDNRIVYDLINLGLKNVLQFANNFAENQNLEIRRLSANLLAQKIMNLNLPSFKFKSFEDVLEVKEKHRDELIALDNYLFDISNKIEPLPFEPGYDDALNRLVERRIQPAIINLRKSVKFSPFQIIKNAYDPMKVLALSIALNNVPPDYINKVVTVGAGWAILEGMVKNWGQARKNLKQSPLSFLIKVQDSA